MLDQLRNLNLDKIDLDDAVAMLTFGSQVEATYKTNSMEAPDWLKDKLEALGKEIKSRRRDNLERALKNAQAKREALKTTEEKRGALDDEITRLTEALK